MFIFNSKTRKQKRLEKNQAALIEELNEIKKNLRPGTVKNNDQEVTNDEVDQTSEENESIKDNFYRFYKIWCFKQECYAFGVLINGRELEDLSVDWDAYGQPEKIIHQNGNYANYTDDQIVNELKKYIDHVEESGIDLLYESKPDDKRFFDSEDEK